MGKTLKPDVIETDSAKAKAKSSKGAPKGRKTRGRTINRRRDRAMRKALKKIEDAKSSENRKLTDELEGQLKLMKEAQARKLSVMGIR